MRASVGAQP